MARPSKPGPRTEDEPTSGSAIGARVDLDPTPEDPQRPRSPTAPSRRPEGDPASFWRRLGAYALDAITIFLVTSVAMELVLGGQPPDVDPLAPESLDVLWPYYALNGAIAWFYFAAMESSPWQATLGKRMVKIHVTDEHGERISFLRATARYLGKILSALPLGLGFLMIFTSERNQALHDHVASCLVVKQASAPPSGSYRNLEDPGQGWDR